MLRVQLIGHLGTDMDTGYTQKGTTLASARLAVNQVRTTQNGERQETTEWFTVRVAGRQTEFAQHLGKGTRVFVDGRLSISHYTSRDGEPRVDFSVWADDIQNLSPRPATGESVGAATGGVGASNTGDDQLDDDLPF
ncbi:MAG: single-stranded DNA-binding protein [Chloroflexi bacterium]|nr:single-stranded DNA-binding protein [Chloroflexota bacterium]MBV9599788.1 single-stranded DNA-binding protein [Chloroflexota bacterium]